MSKAETLLNRVVAWPATLLAFVVLVLAARRPSSDASAVNDRACALESETVPSAVTPPVGGPHRPRFAVRLLKRGPAAGGFAMVVVAFALRTIALRVLPDHLADEVMASVDLRSPLATGQHYNGAPLGLLGRIVPTLDLRFAMAWIGTSVPYLRLIAVLFGMASIGLAYRIGAQLSGRRLGLAVAATLSLMPWHIHFSRLFVPQSQYLFLTLATISCLIGALVRRSLGEGLIAVAAAAASIYVYPASILSTPLVILTVLVAYRQELGRFGALRVAGLGACSAFCLVPYVVDHLFAGASAASNQNDVFVQKLMWTHGLTAAEVLGRIAGNWFSYLDPSFLAAGGDLNIRHSNQRVGQIGPAFLMLGIIGVAAALRRRNRGDLLWLAWLVVYPFSSAITYYNGPGNSSRAIFGCLPWALAAGTGMLFLLDRMRSRSVGVISVAAVVVAAQTGIFFSDYLSGYRVRASPTFEVGWSEVVPALVARGADKVPITVHAGYDRLWIAQYFAKGRLPIAQSVYSCFPLRADAIAATPLPRVYVIRNDYDFSREAGCFQGDLVAADLDVLRAARLPDGRAARVEILGTFPPGQPRPVVVVLVLPSSEGSPAAAAPPVTEAGALGEGRFRAP